MKKIVGLILFVFGWSLFGFGAKFYVDPNQGSMSNSGSSTAPWSTLAEVISQHKIESYHYSPLPYSANSQLVVFDQGAPVQAGDTLVLRDGLHGDIELFGYYNSLPIYVLAEAEHHPVLRTLRVAGCRQWIFKGLTISSEPYGDYANNILVSIESHNWHGPCARIEVADCQVYSTDSPWVNADDWVNKASDGFFVRADSISLMDNQVRNVYFGIELMGDYNQAVGNSIVNFAGDGSRILGSHNLLDGNLIKNCYKVDDNHDDGLQSFTTNGLVVDSNIVRNNIILNYDDPNQPLLGPLQGIGCFDGFFRHWVVENNLIVVNHWHGISFYGAIDCRIVNNTVLDPTPATNPGPSWIKITDNKNGMPSSGCVVKNNVANNFQIDDGIATNNITLATFADYQNEFVNPSVYDFNLLSTSALIDGGDASVAPPFDINGTSRTTNGSGPDIGAYEYDYLVGTLPVLSEEKIVVSPNPVVDYLDVIGEVKGDIMLFSASGLLVRQTSATGRVSRLATAGLPSGIYYLVFRSGGLGRLMVERVFVGG